MPARTERIVIVVDRRCGEQLHGFTRDAHVWAVGSQHNDAVIAVMSNAVEHGADGDVSSPTLTSFKGGDDESPEELCARILGDIEDHHGDFASDGSWAEIEVVGARYTDELAELFESIGATECSVTPSGFICRR